MLSGIWYLLENNAEHRCVDLLHTKQINMQLRPYITSGLNIMSRVAQKPQWEWTYLPFGKAKSFSIDIFNEFANILFEDIPVKRTGITSQTVDEG